MMRDQSGEGQGPISQRFEPVREAVSGLFKTGRLQEAVGLLEEFLREWPENADAHEQLGIAYSSSGDHARALKAFETAARLDSGSAVIRYNMGVAQREAGYLLKAAESFADAIRLDEKSYPAWLARAAILMRLGDCPGAREAAQAAARLRPEEENPWRMLILVELLEGNFPAVGEALEGYRARAGKPAKLFPQLRELVGQRLAVELARVVLARRALLAREAAFFLGEHHYKEEEADAAIACLLDARSLGADDAATLILLSRAYTLRGRMAEAETAVRLATALEPRDLWAWMARGNVLSRLGKHEEAIEAYRTGTRVAPAEGAPWYSLGGTLAQTGHLDESVNAYREAIKAYRAEPRSGTEASRASNNLGATFLSLEREAEARQAFEDAIRYNPENGRAWANLGLLLARHGDREGAIHHLRRALELRPERADLSLALLELEAETPPPVV
jgi:tetratricopeptide (TPR) repeat protein